MGTPLAEVRRSSRTRPWNSQTSSPSLGEPLQGR